MYELYSQSTPFSFHSDSELYFIQGDNRIGGKYWKARYTEYADATLLEERDSLRQKPTLEFWV